MKRSMLWAGLAVVLAAATAAAQEEEGLVVGPAPSICVVKLGESGELEINVMRYVTEIRVETRIAVEGGVERAFAVERLVQVPVYETRLLSTKELKVFDIDGNEIKFEDVTERLKRPTPVLMSPGGKIASLYRDLFQMGTLVLSPAGLGDGPVAVPPSVRGLPPAPRIPPR